MKRVLVAGLTLLVLGGVTGQARQEAAATQRSESRREAECRFQWMDRATWTPREEWRTAKCVVERWPIYGGLTKLLAVADCESSMNRLAVSASGSYVGWMQHALSAWPYRVRSYEPFYWDLKPRWTNTRSQIVVSVRMVRAMGWTPWSCAT